MAPKQLSDTSELYSSNCREELFSHVSCVKLFLAEHVRHGTPYSPGSGGSDDHCEPTRQLYMKCMKARKEHPLNTKETAVTMAYTEGPKLCEMELSIHGNCVANQLERTQKLGEKYFTQGGEDKCAPTRRSYEKCVRLATEAGLMK